MLASISREFCFFSVCQFLFLIGTRRDSVNDDEPHPVPLIRYIVKSCMLLSANSDYHKQQ